MGDINAPEFAAAKELSDFVVEVKNVYSMFVETNVQLNPQGQLFVDLTSLEHVYELAKRIQMQLSLQNWKVKGKEVFIYTDGRANRIILTPYAILSMNEN